jgi:probable rRNA maturation factor
VAGSRRPGSLPPPRERRLAGIARRVLAWERAARTRVEIVLLDAPAMRRLNRRATGRRALTDVLSFAFPQPDGGVIGEVYICPAAAAAWLRTAGNGQRPPGRGKGDGGRVREEIIRLVVHGTLHVLGYDHPEGPGRTRSAMWRQQERYVRRLLGAGR